jgi:cellulose synthase/poly-beta-1,6-N-acetylglucosamine synthase-like glycosyltransferase
VVLYLSVLALLAWRMQMPKYAVPKLRFTVVIPAHNEVEQIAHTVESLKATDYPADLRRIVVVADNCSDDTATRAQAAGARVLERHSEDERGKGYALDFAFGILLQEAQSDAIVVVDADTDVDRDLLRAFESRLLDGAQVLQAEYAVRNPMASWRTKLMAVALGMFHRTRSLARERLGLSVGLRGNGMCFAVDVLRQLPHSAVSLVEDVEYGVKLGLAGKRVVFAHEVAVRGEMVSSGQAAVSQRQRWEQGRFAMVRAYVPRLLAQGFKQRSPMLLDLAVDLLVPPLSYVGLGVAAGVAIEISARMLYGAFTPLWSLWLTACVGLALYLLRGVQHSGLGMYGLVALLYAPLYVLWKLLIARPFGKLPKSWIRTKRE